MCIRDSLITLGLRLKDTYGRTRTQEIWVGYVNEDGSLIGGAVKEDKPYSPVEEAWQKLNEKT